MLESLKKVAYLNCQGVIVGRDLEGDDAKILRERFGDYIHVIENDKNYGFAGGANIGIKYALLSMSPKQSFGTSFYNQQRKSPGSLATTP